MNPASVNVAVVGATGAVGIDLLRVLEARNFPVGNLVLLASARSAGKSLKFKGKDHTVKELTKDSFKGVDIALFSAGGSVSKEYAPVAAAAGAVVVDNSSAFRMAADVPLIVPEINPEEVKNHKGIIANPNCSTIILLMAAYPVHRISPVKRIIVSTYQAASGAGAAAMEELRIQAKDVLEGREPVKKVLPHQIAFNVFSHNSSVDMQSLFNGEEIKMVNETRKILKNSEIRVSATCVRVPTFRAHGESVHLELEKPVELSEVRKAIDAFPGTRVVDDPENNYFPMPIDASGKDDVLVGRIRYAYDCTDKKEIEFFCVGDQLLKGAALNAVQIAELLIR